MQNAECPQIGGIERCTAVLDADNVIDPGLTTAGHVDAADHATDNCRDATPFDERRATRGSDKRGRVSWPLTETSRLVKDQLAPVGPALSRCKIPSPPGGTSVIASPRAPAYMASVTLLLLYNLWFKAETSVRGCGSVV